MNFLLNDPVLKMDEFTGYLRPLKLEAFIVGAVDVIQSKNVL